MKHPIVNIDPGGRADKSVNPHNQLDRKISLSTQYKVQYLQKIQANKQTELSYLSPFLFGNPDATR